jgi:PAT family beta-lactamase induction signal transducer AmpG
MIINNNNRIKNFVIIFFLGFSSGLPLALIMSTLQALLFEYGVNLKTIGLFSLVSIPYNFKVAFAPIIDSFGLFYLSKKLGQRRSWMIATQLLLAIFIASIGIFAGSGNVMLIAIFALLVAFSSASQDLVIDAYRIELIKKEDQGFAATYYIYGYRIAIIIATAGALILSNLFSWNIVYLIMASLTSIGMITVLCADDTRKNWVTKNYNFVSWFKNAVTSPLKDLIKRPKWYLILIFIICFKLSDAFAGSLTMSFLLDLQFSKLEIASIVKTFGLVATLLGAFAGGAIIKKIGINKAILIALIMQMASNLGFCYQAIIGYNTTSLYAVIFAENFSGGIGDAALIAYLSSLCNIMFSATQYSLLMSLASLGRSFFSSSAGVLASKFGWVNFFMFSILLSIPSLLVLFILSKKKIIKLSYK